MQQATHIINKVFLEVNTGSSRQAFALKDNLGVFLKQRLFPVIERYFETKNTVLPGATFRFNKIEIEINQTDIDNLSSLKHNIFNTFKKKIDSEIQNAANHAEDQNKLVILSKSKSKQDAFMHFLQTGNKPWWQSNITNLFDEKGVEAMISDKGFFSRLKWVLADSKVRQRLVNQFSDTVLTRLFSASNSKKIKAKHKIFSILERNTKVRNKFWMAIVNTYTGKKGAVKTMLDELKSNKTIDLKQLEALKSFAAALQDRPLTKEKEIDPIEEKDLFLETNLTVGQKAQKEEASDKNQYLNNAGLVLMHPFLKPLFINAKLTDSKGNLVESKKETAVHLLHYLCTKQEQQLESKLVLERFLCGYPINQSMRRFIRLPEDLKRMAEEVLQAAITHWKALKNTSPDALRTGFLQRQGKLIIEKESCKIVVERKAQDVLLDKIPWNIHLVKLPWLDTLIFVEW